MNEKMLVSGLLIGALIGLATGYTVYQNIDAAKLRQEITILKTQLAEKEDQVTSLQSHVADLEQQLDTEVMGVYFSPRGGCEDQVTYWIGRANRSIHILIYSFTLDSVGNVLINAGRRGVETMVVFEKKEIDKDSEYQRLKVAGINVRNDSNPSYMHDKVMIVDGIIILTGSFNWSQNAEEHNNENLIVIKSEQIAAIYEEEFAEIWNRSIGG